jgi:hypothetical protein
MPPEIVAVQRVEVAQVGVLRRGALGVGRIVALYYRSPTLYQIH